MLKAFLDKAVIHIHEIELNYDSKIQTFPD